MAGFKDFEDIVAWQQAIALAGRVHQRFLDHNDYSFRDQIRRAATSVSSNIAEGFDRGSNKDFRRFLWIAKGSCNEVRSLIWLAHTYGYLDQQERDELRAECRRVAATIQSLIRSLRMDRLNTWMPWAMPFAQFIGHA